MINKAVYPVSVRVERSRGLMKRSPLGRVHVQQYACQSQSVTIIIDNMLVSYSL